MQTVILEIIPSVQAILKVLQALLVGAGIILVLLAVGLVGAATLAVLLVQTLIIKIQRKERRLRRQRR